MKLPYSSALIFNKQIKDSPTYDDKVMITIDISYPVVKIPNKLVQSLIISRTLKNFANKFNVRAEKELFNQAVANYKDSLQTGFPFFPYDAMQTYEVTYNRKDLLSLYFDQYVYTDGAHGNTERTGFTFNNKTGLRMKLQDFFNSSGYLKVMYDEIIRQIEVQLAENPGIYFDDYKKNVVKYFEAKNFYLSNKGFVIFYPLYTIAPYVTGIAAFTIPYAMLKRYMIRPL